VKRLLFILAVLVVLLGGCGNGKSKYEVAPHAAPSAVS
jgi:hypothetical protein